MRHYPNDRFSIFSFCFCSFLCNCNRAITCSDDGVRIEIDDMTLIDEWNTGIHFVTASRFLEQGRLYPIRIRMFDELYSSQFRLRWSSSGFSEEVVPASQLYPADYLSASEVSGITSIESISSRELRLMTEIYKDGEQDVLKFVKAR